MLRLCKQGVAGVSDVAMAPQECVAVVRPGGLTCRTGRSSRSGQLSGAGLVPRARRARPGSPENITEGTAKASGPSVKVDVQSLKGERSEMTEAGNRSRPHDYTSVPDTTSDVYSTTRSAPSIDSKSVIEVPLDERLADNPLNARHSLGELDGLEVSIRARGILQPLIVVRAEAFRLAHPDVSVDKQVEWVLLAGHRRRAAAYRAGIATAIAIERNDLLKIEDSAAVALVENVHRAGLSPLEEARVLSVLKDLGLSQREISVQTGISQGQVSKRLKLLDLPTQLQDRIEDGSLKISDALTIQHVLSDPQDQLHALYLSQDVGRPLKRVLRQLRWERSAQSVAREQTTEKDSIAPVEGPQEALQDGSHTPVEEQPLDVSMAPAVIKTTLTSKEHDMELGVNHESQELHAAACSARIEACRRAVKSRLSAEQITDVLVDATLDPPIPRSTQARNQASSMAVEWTATLLPADFDANAPYNLLGGRQGAAQRLAVAIVFSHREIDLASAAQVFQPWQEAARRHVRRLAAWGVHTLSAYEHVKLTEAPAVKLD
jgi:ParB/RepB/Spo0J family partition protein